MRLVVLVGTVLMLGTCVNSQGGSNNQECSDVGSCAEPMLSRCKERNGVCKANQCCVKSAGGIGDKPDVSVCNNTDRVLMAVLADANCQASFLGMTGSNIDFSTYCSSLIDGLKCAAASLMKQYNNKEANEMCFQTMMGLIKESADVIFAKIQDVLGQGVVIDKGHISKSGTCPVEDKDEDGDGDKDWNSSCPKIDELGICPEPRCSTDGDCTQGSRTKCCNIGGQECNRCMPDFQQCGNIEKIMEKKVACGPKLLLLAQAKEYTEYCSYVWDAFDCIAEELIPTEKELCLKRMAVFVQRSPLDVFRAIITALKTMLQIPPGVEKLVRHAKDTASCKGSPLYEAPVRPVPDDVKECFNKTVIMNAATQCGRITASRATNEACGNLKTLVECIAGRLVRGRDENMKRKCAGEIYEFVEDNREAVSNIVGNLNPGSCEERTSVCGGDLKPLDSANCKTSNRCPATYVCKEGHCCPQEKEGACPREEMAEMSICKQECKMDSQCGDDEKCCNSKSLGHKVCMKTETETETDTYNEEMSMCDKQFEIAKRQLWNQGICGAGNTLTKLPLCQNKRFSPLQTIPGSLRGYCAMENGTKIRGSDFIGNKDCTKVRKGLCPTTPSQCTSVAKAADTCQSDDHNCADDEKCCIAYEGMTCLKKCIKANEAPETVSDDCQDRKCCPLTLCDFKVCLKDRTARCRINSCGKCEAEFYNLNGKVNCDEGASQCQKERATAREENARRSRSDFDRIAAFVKSRDRKERQMRDKADFEKDDDEMEDRKEVKKDEYGMERKGQDDLPDDTADFEDEGDMKEMHRRMASVSLRLCAVFDKFNICKNGGECVIGNGESFWQMCKCKTGYSGLLCETAGSVKPLDSKCYRDQDRVKMMHTIMMTTEYMREQLAMQEVFNKLQSSLKLMTSFSCDPVTGKYDELQMATVLPKTIDTVMVYYCVNTTSGMRMRGTPVTLAQSGHMPDCTVTTALPDILGLPKKCMSSSKACEATDQCQYFWNQTTGMCEKGMAGDGFLTLTDCYERCSMQRGCTNDPMGHMVNSEDFVCEKGIILGPKPCRMTGENSEEYDMCDYDREFCEVVESTSGQSGTCTEFPSYCLEQPDSGMGDQAFGAYHYDIKARKCGKFEYGGRGGNNNRFSSLHQCHTECSARSYKFNDVVCPVPKMLAMSVKGQDDTCAGDVDCPNHDVCCSTGKIKVCTSPIRTCFTSVRCSLQGSCLEGKCVCDDCSDTPKSEVCGSDGMTYPSVCHLRKKSCEMMQNITVAFNGSCKTKCGDSYCEKYEMCDNNVCKCADICTAQYQPVCGKSAKSGAFCTFGNECEMDRMACQKKERFVKVKDETCSPGDSSGTCMLPCTRENNPLCVYDTTDETAKLDTYPNPCRLREALLNGKKVKVLYPGECAKKCGSKDCEHYQICYNDTCQCQKGCTKDYRPICAHPINNDAKLVDFANLCLMKQQSCQEEKTYLIVKHGPCKDTEPVYDCPTTRPNIPYSSNVECNADTNAGCDTEMGEKCCSYGAGEKCLPMKALVRRKTMKDGICPSPNTIDANMCVDSHMCMSDGDCAGESKCCENDYCGNICVAPRVRGVESPCGANAKMMSACSSNANDTGCLQKDLCKSVMTSEDEKVDVCCVSTSMLSRPDIANKMMNAMLCKIMAIGGITCANGGTCIGDLRGGHVCQCMDGFSGPLCRDTVTVPPAAGSAECNTVNCPANPCDVNTCPGVPEATCEANYCGRCNAIFKNGSVDVTHLCSGTPCRVQKEILMTLANTVKTAMDDGSNMEDEGGMKRRRRDSHMEDNEEMDDDANPFKKMLKYWMKHMGIYAAPVCTSDGHFKLEQCAQDMMSGSQHCYCVDGRTGMRIPNGPKVSSIERLNCSYLVGIQDFCHSPSEMPSKAICGGTMTKRYFFNPATMECEIFSDYGCNVDSRNNFVDKETCKSVCGGSSYLSKCAAVRCASGTCRIEDGNAVCVESDDFKAKFEPMCDADGMYTPKQCHGGMCKCVNRETGEMIANSEAEGKYLECHIEGGVVTVNRTQTKTCEGSQNARFCANGGDICDNCKVDAAQGGNDAGDDSQVDSNNVCTSCQSCPTGRKICDTEKLCINKCKRFPKAVCQINRCTCAEEYKANGRVVNCSAGQSECKEELHNLMMEEKMNERQRNNGNQPENKKQLKCSETGAYLAECMGTQCFCLNATSGCRVGGARTGSTPDTINCNAVQRRTEYKKMMLKLKFLGKNWSDMNSRQQDAFKGKIIDKVQSKGVKVNSVTIVDGSIEVTLEIEKDPVQSELDLASVGNDIIQDANEGDFTIDVEGEILVASTGTVTGGVTAEELEGPVTEKAPEDDDNTTTIIIVVVVVVVVVIVAIGIACYCYTKANKSKTKDIPFSDIQGKSNPAYDKP